MAEPPRNEKKKVARKRWAILARALKSPSGSEPSSPTDEFSQRRVSFMLLRTQPINLFEDPARTWFKYSLEANGRQFSVNIGHRNRSFSAEDLMGFNNTGNVCIWPSEEALACYICSNLGDFRDKTILELGGGMSCLAGLFAAKFAAPARVLLTDGNKASVENVAAALRRNELGCCVECAVLKWGPLADRYDVVLCADCLFFDEARADLIGCLGSCLGAERRALVMAPRRGSTLQDFVEQCRAGGLHCSVRINYNAAVWERRLSLLPHGDFDDDIHYPILIEVTKV